MVEKNDDNDDPHYNTPKIDSGKEAARKSTLLKQKNPLEEKVRIAITSIIASASLTVLKFVIGFSTNSLGILSESMHSGLDFIARIDDLLRHTHSNASSRFEIYIRLCKI